MTQDIFGRIHRRNLHLAHVNRSSCRSPASLPSSLTGLFIRGEVEGYEEEEIGAQDTHASKGGKFFTGALAVTREIGEVSRGKVGVGSEVHEAWNEISECCEGAPILTQPYRDL